MSGGYTAAMHVDLPSGIRIDYEAFGPASAPPVVLIMGLGMQLTAWPMPLVDGLVERGFRVVRFDNRDVGLSTHLRPHARLSRRSRRRFAAAAARTPVHMIASSLAKNTIAQVGGSELGGQSQHHTTMTWRYVLMQGIS